jgi:hypothetical protein
MENIEDTRITLLVELGSTGMHMTDICFGQLIVSLERESVNYQIEISG